MKKRGGSLILVTLLTFMFMPNAALPAMALNTLVKVLVEPTMDYNIIYEFSEGLAIAQKGGALGYSDAGTWGFIDKTGKVVIPLIYDDVSSFSEGLAAVSKDGKWGYIDKTGGVVVPLIYEYAWSFSEGLAAVEKDEKYGFINRMGEVVIPFLYSNAFKFSEGLAKVTNYDAEVENWHGYIDKTGAMVILNDISWGDFSEGLAVAIASVGKDLKYGYIDKSGKLVVPLQYDYAKEFGEGLASVEKDGKWGYIDKTGKVVIPFLYQYASDYSEGLAVVGGQDGRFYIDKTGKDAFPNAYSGDPFSDGIARVGVARLDEEGFLIDNGWWNLINKTGELLLPLENKYTRMWYAEGLAVVEQDGKWGILQVTVNPSSWAQADVASAISLGLVPDDLQFKYTQATTRAEFCALAVTLYETVTGQEITGRGKFNDTTDVNVEKAAFIGVVNGTSPGKFTPNTSLTREQAATMLARLANAVGKPFPKTSATFDDKGSLSDWALEAVGQVQAAGIMQGTSPGKFSPAGPYTREQSIVTILRMYNALG